jgi:hypothetical protein
MTAPNEPTVAAQVRALGGLSVDQLRARYADLYGEETKGRHKVWLFRACAWRLQELAFGGLSERARRRAEELVREGDVRPRVSQTLPVVPGAGPTHVVNLRGRDDPSRPPPGTVLVRRYKGREVRVTVREVGFELDGTVYGSLSAVAQAVTGAHWSGALFFGLRRHKPAGTVTP